MLSPTHGDHLTRPGYLVDRTGTLRRVRTAARPLPALGLVCLLAVAAFPVRLGGALPGTPTTVSLFDLAMPFVLAHYLFLVLSSRSAPSGRPYGVLRLGIVTGVVCAASVLWSVNTSETLLVSISHAEAVLVFLYVLMVTRNRSPASVICYICLYLTLLLIPAILLEAHVSGFQPPPEVDRNSGDYLSYFVRLSHPFIGRSNNLATLLGFFALPLLYWALRHTSRMAGLFSLVAFTGVVLTFSRGVLLGLLIGFLGLALTTRGIGVRVFALAFLGMVVSALLSYVFYTSSSDVQLTILNRLSFQGVQDRFDLLSVVGDISNGNWWIGSGGNASISVHNVFLQQFVDYGLFLSVPLSLVFLWTLRSFFGRRASEAGRAVGWGMVALFASFLSESSFEGTLLLPLLFLGFGLGVALVLAQERAAPCASSSGKAKRPTTPDPTPGLIEKPRTPGTTDDRLGQPTTA